MIEGVACGIPGMSVVVEVGDLDHDLDCLASVELLCVSQQKKKVISS